MRWRVLAIGKPKLQYASLGVEEYTRRLKPLAAVELEYLKAPHPGAQGSALLERSAGCFRIVLDERGKPFTSKALASQISAWKGRSLRDAAVLIGGSDGHGAAVRDSADLVWSLSPLTLQHELVLVVLLEQLYRAYTIKAGLPYHRE